MSEYDLGGQIALITGASRLQGIGAAVARELAGAGAEIFITYYRPYDLEMPWGSDPGAPEQLLADLRQRGVRAAGVELDLSQPEVVPALYDRAESELGPVTILINNAVYSTPGGIDEVTSAQLDRHYAVNVRAMVLLCQEFAWRLPEPPGRIVNLTSGQGLGPMAGELAYAASKGAVESFTVSLSAALAPRGITVNAVDPGITDTGWLGAAEKRAWVAKAPFGRIGRPQDAARLIRFLVSPAGSWITGQILHSRGGL
jgi:3-oxoacyl-[acyl-carrier protein] reductase